MFDGFVDVSRCFCMCMGRRARSLPSPVYIDDVLEFRVFLNDPAGVSSLCFVRDGMPGRVGGFRVSLTCDILFALL